MKRCLVAVDSFKGSMRSVEIGEILKEALPNTNFIPIADGGEGSLEVLFHINPQYQWVTFNGFDTYLNPTKQRYLISGDTAYIESAMICGFLKGDNDILNSSSYGVGLALKDAYTRGIKHIYLFMGGTGSNDGGMGLLVGLGYQFNQKPIAKNMIHIQEIIEPKDLIHFESVTLMSDVNNPLLGKRGATYTFGPQKGGDDKTLNALEKGMTNLSVHINALTQSDYTTTQGSGAAGGLGFPLLGLMNAKIKSGIHFIAEINNLEETIKKHDVIITGEGKIDSQSFDGKVIDHVVGLCHKHKKPYVLICGINELKEYNDPLCLGIYQLIDVAGDIDASIRHGKCVLRRWAKHFNEDS